MSLINTLLSQERFHTNRIPELDKKNVDPWFNTMFMIPASFLILLIPLVLLSCQNKEEEEQRSEGKITIHFYHKVNGENLEIDTVKYINAAGNPYLISEIQYFISDVTLYKSDGTSKLIGDWKEIHYVDTDIPETHTWDVYDKITTGQYDSVAFRFGISAEKNISFMYVNPPESFMFWPEYLGGGYHYMKLNGKWIEEGQTILTTPFNCHLGIGQIYFSYPDSISGYIHNDFRVSLPGSSFKMSNGGEINIHLLMNIENWFKEPHVYDLDYFGGYTMQNQEAMQALKENGYNVFSVYID